MHFCRQKRSHTAEEPLMIVASPVVIEEPLNKKKIS